MGGSEQHYPAKGGPRDCARQEKHGNFVDMLEETYKTGLFKSHQLTDAKRLIEKRREKDQKAASWAKLANSAYLLAKTYQRKIALQRKIVL